MALKKEIATSGNNLSIRWYDDVGNVTLMVEHMGITNSAGVTTGTFANGFGLTPITGVGLMDYYNGNHFGSPRYSMTSTTIRFRNVENVGGFPNRATPNHYYACWIKSGGPTVATSGLDELTVGSNGNGYYAEFRQNGVMDRTVTGGVRAGSTADNPHVTHTTPVSMTTSDFPCCANIYTTSNLPYIMMLNAVSANGFKFSGSQNFTLVNSSFSWMAEYIRGG